MSTLLKESIDDYNCYPDNRGHFGQFGGIFVAETLMGPLRELSEAYEKYKNDADFWAEYDYDLKHFVGRPSPLFFATRLTEKNAGAQIWLKRERI